MPYIIDGHNLIPKVPGLSLDAMDDEIQLVEYLQKFSRRTQKKIEVYFDKASTGLIRKQSFGMVKVFFPSPGRIADDEIRLRLQKLGRAARNWTVISSDRQVVAAAKAVYATSITSEAFVNELISDLGDLSNPEEREYEMDDAELTDWLALFGEANEGDS